VATPAPARPRTSELAWPGFTSAWAWLPPHDHETVTGAHQVGVAFSGHRDVHVRSGSRTDRTVIGAADPVIVGVAGIIRRAHVASAYVGETAGSSLGHLLVRHFLMEYGGQRLPPAPGHTRLTRVQVGRVADLVAAHLSGGLTLDRLAAETHLSPHHFARAFKATVGQAPYAYVTARRMDRARLLLATTGLGVAEVANAVGFANLSHFRRVFKAHAGTGPAAYRSEVR
jgi:AraC family transcriptional regulator